MEPPQETQAQAAGETDPGAPQDPRPSLLSSLVTSVKTTPIEAAQVVGRIFIIIFSSLYFVRMILGGDQQGVYDLVLQCFLGVSALRFYARCGRPRLALAYMEQCLAEDAFHYIFFSFIALNDTPQLTMLFGPFIYSGISIAQYFSKICKGSRGGMFSRPLGTACDAIVDKSSKGFEFIARSEIISFAIRVVRLFFDLSFAGFMKVFVFGHFLRMRYNSRRNKHPRLIWIAVGNFIESLVNKPACPGFVRNLYVAVLRAKQQAQQRMQPQPQPPQQTHQE